MSEETAAGAVRPVPDARRSGSGCRKSDVGSLHAYVGRYTPDRRTLGLGNGGGMEENQNGYGFTVRHMGSTVTMPLAGYLKRMFFQLRSKILAKIVKYTEYFY